MSYQYRSEYGGLQTPEIVIPALPGLGGAYRTTLKRVLDVVLVAVVSVPVLLIVALLAAIVALDGKSPFYSQPRIGRNGRVFRMWKLRSMVPNAEAALADYLASDPAAAAEWRVHQKLRDDPRVTPVGHLLRRSSLDELPQLWNVLRGEMSIVGPRPMMVDQKDLYPGREYYRMRPGLTGFWQIGDRTRTSFADRARFDQAYYAQMSLTTDLMVMIRTVGVVLRQTGH